jgi:hypothetical protein
MANALLQKLQQGDFSDLAGTVFRLEVPIPLALLNDVIREAIKKVEVLEEVKITDIKNGAVTMLIRTNIFTFKERVITGRIVEELDLQKPAIRIEILDGLKLAGRTLVSMALPDGMELDNRELCISLHHYLFTTPESKVLLKIVKYGAIVTQNDNFLLRLQIEC